MIENINKSKMTFDKYQEIKGKTITKSYSEKYKWVDHFMYAFSWFGNGVSIFLAFFFLQSLFDSSFSVGIEYKWATTIGIIFFLTMFELLKRYVFSLFSLEFIKVQHKIFKRSMITFIFSVLLLLSGSMYLSLNGAQKFIDNQSLFTEQTNTATKIDIDSVINYYNNTLIMPLKAENTKLNIQNDDYFETSTKMYSSKYTALIDANNNKIVSNSNKVTTYELERDSKVTEIKQFNSDNLDSSLAENKNNVITFILISLMIELIIIFGIYYDKYYDYRTVKEYEDTVISTPEFKTWHKYNFLLELICNTVKDVGQKIPSSDNIIDMARIAKSTITKPEFDRFISILYLLEILSKEGNRRVLNLPLENAKTLLQEYYNIK